jgi:hypothetical protein
MILSFGTTCAVAKEIELQLTETTVQFPDAYETAAQAPVLRGINSRFIGRERENQMQKREGLLESGSWLTGSTAIQPKMLI